MLRIIILFLLSSGLKAQDVYKTPSGSKYHTGTCQTVKNVSEKITVAKARELGLEPCKICKPASFNRLNIGSFKKTGGESATVQCKGFTKSGSRCKHRTRIANGYCFQHDPEKH